jgi:hypothetical protein
MNENLHTPDSFIVPSTNLLKVKNLIIRSLHIPDSFNIGQQLRKVDLSSIYFCQGMGDMNNNLDEWNLHTPVLLPSANFSRAYHNETCIPLTVLSLRSTNFSKSAYHETQTCIPDSFICFAAMKLLKREDLWTENLHTPDSFIVQSGFKSKTTYHERNFISPDSFIIAANKLLKSKTNLSWTKTCILTVLLLPWTNFSKIRDLSWTKTCIPDSFIIAVKQTSQK